MSACAVAEAVASRYFGKGWAEEVSVRVRDWRAPPFDPGAETPAGSVIVVSESRLRPDRRRGSKRPGAVLRSGSV